jgi:hypothetical protein
MQKWLQHLCAHSGLLHRAAFSTQQPPFGRLSVPELAKRESVKAQQLIISRKVRETWGTRDKASDGLSAHGTMCALPSHTLHGSPAPWQQWLQKGTTRLQDMGPQPPAPWTKKKGEVSSLVTKVLCLFKPPSSYLQPPLSSSSDPLPCQPTSHARCPRDTIPVLTHTLLAPTAYIKLRKHSPQGHFP